MLKIEALSAGYGASTVLEDVSLHIDDGECVAILGPNGAGKSTLMQVIMGILRAHSGTLEFDSQRIDRLSTAEMVRRGVVLCPERRHLFPGMSVQENLNLGAHLRRDRNRVSEDLERTLEMFPRLKERLALKAGVLSGGEQQMVAIGRALMSRPRLLLLDEPSLGLAPLLVENVLREVGRVNRDGGVALCLVEQNARAALDIASRAYILESGRVVLEGTAAALADDSRVRDAYLGVT